MPERSRGVPDVQQSSFTGTKIVRVQWLVARIPHSEWVGAGRPPRRGDHASLARTHAVRAFKAFCMKYIPCGS